MRRREFIKVVALATAWPLAVPRTRGAKAGGRIYQCQLPQRVTHGKQQLFLKAWPKPATLRARMYRSNIAGRKAELIGCRRWSADLVRRHVAVIAATSTPAAIAAKAATTTVPIVFETGADPIQLGLIINLSRPGGNVTGITQTNAEMVPKRLELLYELVPTARVMALLVNPNDLTLAEAYAKDVQAAARALGVELHILNAGTGPRSSRPPSQSLPNCKRVGS